MNPFALPGHPSEYAEELSEVIAEAAEAGDVAKLREVQDFVGPYVDITEGRGGDDVPNWAMRLFTEAEDARRGGW